MNQNTEQKLMKISEVTKQVGVSRKALQEYDKLDLDNIFFINSISSAFSWVKYFSINFPF